MAVIIKDMEIPKMCREWIPEMGDYKDCPFLDTNDNCKLQANNRFGTWEKQYAVCPIKEIPTADIVSRKAVKDGFIEMCNLICPYTEKQRHVMCGSCLLGTAFDVLEATPSVS